MPGHRNHHPQMRKHQFPGGVAVFLLPPGQRQRALVLGAEHGHAVHGGNVRLQVPDRRGVIEAMEVFLRHQFDNGFFG